MVITVLRQQLTTVVSGVSRLNPATCIRQQRNAHFWCCRGRPRAVAKRAVACLSRKYLSKLKYIVLSFSTKSHLELTLYLARKCTKIITEQKIRAVENTVACPKRVRDVLSLRFPYWSTFENPENFQVRLALRASAARPLARARSGRLRRPRLRRRPEFRSGRSAAEDIPARSVQSVMDIPGLGRSGRGL